MKQPTTALLEIIPRERLSRKQKAFCTVKEGLPLYRFTREPTSLDDFDWDKYPDVAIWRENESIICASKIFTLRRYQEKHVYFSIDHVGNIMQLECAVFGNSDAAVAETAAFFWSLQHSGEGNKAHPEAALWINDVFEFHFAPLTPEQLARVLDSNPTRHFAFRTGTWNAAQATVLASRPYPLHLRLSLSPLDWGTFAFTDGGKAFVDALQTREFSFGTLILVFHTNGVPHDMPFSPANLKRLLKLKDLFDELDICN